MKMKTTCGLLVLTYLIALVVGRTYFGQIELRPSVASIGNNVDIICNSSSLSFLEQPLPNSLIYFHINGGWPEEYVDRSRFSLVSEGHITTIKYYNVNLDDNGFRFSCHFGDIGDSDEVYLTVLYPPIISSYHGGAIRNGFVGDEVTFTFNVDAQANPLVLTANNISITGPGTADDVIDYGSQVTITFSNLMRSDAGDYVVTVTNSAGSGNATFSLDVFFGPNFLQQPSGAIYKTIGANLTLNCSVESNPPANVTFTTTATTTSNVAINPTTGIVTITNTVLGNTGDYTCIADNNLVTQTFNVSIEINESYTTADPTPTDGSIGLVGTTTAVLVVLLGIIAAVFVN